MAALCARFSKKSHCCKRCKTWTGRSHDWKGWVGAHYPRVKLCWVPNTGVKLQSDQITEGFRRQGG